MLYWLHQLKDVFAPFGLIERAETRAILAAASAFVLVIALGRWFIRYLTSRRVLEQTQRGDSQHLDALHASKSSTPTLGGVVWFACVVVSTLLWAHPGERLVLLLVAYLLGLAAVGFADDFKKLRTKKGISARVKFRLQVALSLLAGAYLYAFPLEVTHATVTTGAATSLFFPFFKDLHVPLGLLYVPFVAFVMAGASNAVNLTDGLDGLAAGCSLLVVSALAVVAVAVGHASSSAALHVPHVEGGLEVAVFLGALLGGGLGFLWFNCHPARIFMGDTGALPLGGCIGLAAVLLKQELLLVIVGGVLVAEALSVILQVASFKLTRKRIFLIAPLHHHFQFKGWPETTITTRFWIAGTILAIVSLVTLGA
jgi:phospho-N-acetylmuramoyl-pentapeptide-transferase